MEVNPARFNGVARSEDGGQSWSRYRAGTNRGEVAADVQDLEAAYLAFGECRQAGDQCVSYGQLWYVWGEDPGDGQLLAEFNSRVTALTISVDGIHLWIATEDGRIQRSGDQGMTWASVEVPPGSHFFVKLAASPHNPRLLYAVSVNGEIWSYHEESS
jgi:photosystem II stability/assembly factor-like uncharacterized protein